MGKTISVYEAIDLLEADNDWRRFQVDYPETVLGDLEIQRFNIPKLDRFRIDTILYEGMERDPGSGDFCRLVERVYDEEDENSFIAANGKRYRIWMSDTRAEITEHGPIIDKIWLCEKFGQAKRILINGLGLGLIAHGALSFPGVEHIDIVENNPDVIELVGQHLTADPRVTIHLDDALTIKWPRGTKWDLGWHDIWPLITDENLPEMDRLRARYRRSIKWQGSWQRKGCLEMARSIREMKAGTLSPEKARRIFSAITHERF